MKNILFIINPNSGTGKYKSVIRSIDTHLDKNLFKYKTIYTERPNHATEICNENKDKFDIIVAVGGDGTINEVVQAMVNSNTSLGIIPTGSGNGLTRFLKIPQSPDKAIKLINSSKAKPIDTITINDRVSINVSGVGFDGRIAHIFANFGKRGFLSYIKIVIKEFFSYKLKNYKLKFNGKSVNSSAFLVSIANSGQFGNNAYIAPNAIINDGQMDVVILRKFSLLYSPILAIRMFGKSINRSKVCSSYKTSELVLESDNIEGHIDGEPVELKSPLHIKVNPASINLIYP